MQLTLVEKKIEKEFYIAIVQPPYILKVKQVAKDFYFAKVLYVFKNKI